MQKCWLGHNTIITSGKKAPLAQRSNPYFFQLFEVAKHFSFRNCRESLIEPCGFPTTISSRCLEVQANIDTNQAFYSSAAPYLEAFHFPIATTACREQYLLWLLPGAKDRGQEAPPASATRCLAGATAAQSYQAALTGQTTRRT